ncbi:beta-lactamase family protein [Rossellomorea vietnamensis]|uniref:Beta-lactamase family protein n=1 Tax=Rossellomorea vietnamensis TaxID=218284 RepID=A0A5D4MHB3_9BACI|nr:serine hydrolase domain-containing protein [Rossellomorea vietnamensis]TYS01220.1 beta-lactamase family protein [Rossellomorea vietnamensis]
MTTLNEKLDQISRYINETLNEQQGVGVAVSIVQGSDIIYSNGFGHSQGQPVNKFLNEETLMSIQSVSKNFMALSIMQLVEDNKVSLDHPVVHYLPYFRTKDKQQSDTITIRQILSHTAGLPAELGIANMTAPNVREIFSDTPTEFHEALDHYNLSEEELNSINNREDVTRWFEKVELEYEVGKGWNYCTDAYVILADLFEKVTGGKWETHLRDNVLAPLKMERATWEPDMVENDENSARYYLGEEKVETPFPKHPLSAPIGYLYSSANDLARYLLFHLNSESTILDSDLIKEMQEPVSLVSEEWRFGSEARSYGLAWFTDIYRGFKVVEHGGGQMAVRSLISMVPELNLGVVVLLNFDGNLHHDICDKIIDTFIDG